MTKAKARQIAIAMLLGSLSAKASVAEEPLPPLPANTAPGIVEFEQGESGFAFASRELDGARVFQTTSDLPLRQIRGDRSGGQSNKMGCYPATVQLACILDVTIDGQREIWFYRRGDDGETRSLTQLPDRVVSDLFWFAPSHSLVGDGPLSLAALPIGSDIPAKVWLENTGEGNAFHSFELLRPNQLVMARQSFEGDELAGLFLILSRTGELYITPSEGVEILAAAQDGTITTYSVPANCEVLGAIRDHLICGANTRGNSSVSFAPQYPKVMRLRLPVGIVEDIMRDNQAPAFQVLENSILVRGMKDGVARPYIQQLGEGEATSALDNADSCIRPHEHVDVFEVTTSRNAALMRVMSPLRPTRLVLAPVEGNRIHICSPLAQPYREETYENWDHSGLEVERLHSRDVPVTLVSGGQRGSLSGHLLTITYSQAALWLPEGYLGPWLSHWIGKGGRIAFVHLPGGGGYGAEWSSSGFGIANKIEVSRLFDEVTADLIAKGLAVEGSISVLTESGGGPVMAHAILRSPARYRVLALRAACLAIEGETRANCTKHYEYGNWLLSSDRALMAEFRPLERIVQSAEFPKILWGLPETDSSVDLTYQRRMIEGLAGQNVQVVDLVGTDHTNRGSHEVEERWVQAITDAVRATGLSE